MTGLTPYLTLPGTARAALERYREVFGGELVLGTFAEMGRTDGPGDAIGHGMLQGRVTLFASDAGEGDDARTPVAGVMFALLGTAPAQELESWFAALAEGGRVVDPLQPRPWGDHDGQVVDAFGVHWLIGYQG